MPRFAITAAYASARKLVQLPGSSPIKATWRTTVIADSDDTVVVEGNHYFPQESLAREHLRASTHTSTCAWKGTAHYYDVVVGHTVNPNAAWYYPAPKDAASQIKDRVAFWKGVVING